MGLNLTDLNKTYKTKTMATVLVNHKCCNYDCYFLLMQCLNLNFFLKTVFWEKKSYLIENLDF